jgi:hypothetical protein
MQQFRWTCALGLILTVAAVADGQVVKAVLGVTQTDMS